ncbi:MAG: alpha/beta fold hydrolase [Deltaproteobacteria bacterium]|nr:alpha/beta fold hydrolase [Deltaproteobacteria bacterium]MBW2382841.1 alpha/beta fold hydrolase [Deltaproteobacteria bacterium]MBW2696529.1 alpha/beta fold hydrolase [Deltaproteobacteria bacterium]
MSEMLEASDGVQLYVECHSPAGDFTGVSIVFSCAYTTTHENWRPQVAPLVEAGHSVALWDYRGHGLSSVPEDPAAYSMDRVVDDLGRVIDRVSPDAPAVLAGLSFGGLASLHFSLRRPERVRGLVLADSGPGFKKAEAAAEWLRRSKRTADYIEAKGFDAFVSGRAAATCIGRDPDQPAARAAAAAIRVQSRFGVATFGRRVAGLAPSVIDELAQITQPALVIVGAEDDAYLRAAEVMTAKLPDARHEVIPGAGHIVNIEAESAFNERVVEFLAELAEE